MTVLVAGGTGALGTAVVHELLDAGYACELTWIVDSERDRIEAALSDRVSLVRADLTDPDGGVADAVAGVDDLQAVVNLVGGYSSGPLVHETDPADFRRMVELNLTPAFLLAREAMPRLVARGGGAFVGVSARAALRPFAGAAGYIAGKAALLAFVQALDAEYKGQGVRANAILPERDRHARQPLGPARRRLLQVGRAAGDRQGGPLPGLGRVRDAERRRGAGLRPGVRGLGIASLPPPAP